MTYTLSPAYGYHNPGFFGQGAAAAYAPRTQNTWSSGYFPANNYFGLPSMSSAQSAAPNFTASYFQPWAQPAVAQSQTSDTLNPLMTLLLLKVIQSRLSAVQAQSQPAQNGFDASSFFPMFLMAMMGRQASSDKQSSLLNSLLIANAAQASTISELKEDVSGLEASNTTQANQITTLKTQVATQTATNTQQQAEIDKLKTTLVESVTDNERTSFATTAARPNADITASGSSVVTVKTGSKAGVITAAVSERATTNINNENGSTVNASAKGDSKLNVASKGSKETTVKATAEGNSKVNLSAYGVKTVVNATAAGNSKVNIAATGLKAATINVTSSGSAQTKVDTSKANDTVNLTNNGGTVVANTYNGNDTVNVKASKGTTNVNTGAGNDTVKVGTLTKGAVVNINGGTGKNTVTLTGKASDYTIAPKNRNRNSPLLATEKATGAQVTLSGFKTGDIKFTA